jgi:hypothetical protein
MTTVTGLTADRMLSIEGASVIDGDVDSNGNLILTKHDGTQINAGSVKGPAGPQGPPGSLISTLSSVPILDVGLSNQIRAGRQLSPADFAAIGLSAPLGLWNLSDLSDASGNGRALSNKGAVPFAGGINGVANTAAQFVGSTAQALYIPDTGANDPFRIKTCTLGCWIKTAKSGANQYVLSKVGSSASSAVWNWSLLVENSSSSGSININNGAQMQLTGHSNVTDDRWHFIVGTYDSSILSIYIDGLLENSMATSGVLQQIAAPVNIGSLGGDGSTASAYNHYGRVDEAFVTSDILSEDQVRALYCAKIPHTLGFIPTNVTLNVRRRKKGALFAVSDFPTQPLRLYNFSAGSLGDQGSNNQTLTNGGTALSVAGVDGSAGNAFNFNGAQSLNATDAGLPSGVATRSYGCWLRTTAMGQNLWIIAWGAAAGTNDMGLWINTANNIISLTPGDNITGPFICDGQWHFVVITEDNAPNDGIKRKMYLDGRLVGTSLIVGSVVSGGAGHFRVGSRCDGSATFVGNIDGAFVCDYALTADQIHALYAKGSQALSPSPKNVGDHVEGMDAANLYATFDALESQHQIDLAVA